MSNLREVLTDIYERNGKLTPEIVVEEARPEGAPLHHRFEWDDSVAGEAYRRVQASELVRSVKIQLPDSPKGERKYIRAFQSLHQTIDPERFGYVPTEEVVQDEMLTRILLKQLEREITDLKRKYGHLAEFADYMRKAAS